MRITKRLAILFAVMLGALPARAGEPRIGLAAPLSGASALLGAQMEAGASAAVASDGKAALVVKDTGCSAEGGADAARALVAEGVDIVTGFVCMAAVEAAMPALTAAGIPVIVTGVRVDALTDRRDKTGWPVFRLAPRADAEAQAVARMLTRAWRSELFAIIDDGTIYGRELAESLRVAAELAGLEPVFIDTFRPQLPNQIALAGRLRKAGATHVFAGGDRADIALLGQAAAELGYDVQIAGGEALRAARDEADLVAGTLMVAPPDWADIADPAIVAALRRAGTEPDGYVLPAYAAVEVALAARRAAADTPVADVLAATRFETALGAVRFNDIGDWAGTRYRLFRYDGQDFKQVDLE